MSSLWPQATFIKSAPDIHFLPKDIGKEVAFIGRSNVGKSSLLNALTHKNLARTSKTPGRTQALNCFALDDYARLIDVPGMGFATSSIKTRRHWSEMLSHYLVHREALQGVILICDIRHDLQKWDQTLIQWCQNAHHPLHIVMNKADKLTQSERSKRFKCLQETIQSLHPQASMQWISVKKKQNFFDLHHILKTWLTDES